MLASLPGGPGPAEARHRLASGLPLAVGLSRFETERLQDRLVDLGLVPRIGPAPEGTQPLAPERPPRSRLGLLALAGAAAIAGLLVWMRGAAPPPAPVTPTPEAPRARAARPQPAVPRGPASPAIPDDERLELWAQLRAAAGGLQLVGWVRGRGGEPPEGPLTLSARAAGAEVASQSLEKPSIATQRRSVGEGTPPLVTWTASFRLPLPRAELAGAEEVVLVARWDERRSAPLAIRLPGGG